MGICDGVIDGLSEVVNMHRIFSISQKTFTYTTKKEMKISTVKNEKLYKNILSSVR